MTVFEQAHAHTHAHILLTSIQVFCFLLCLMYYRIIKNRQLSKFKVNFSLIYSHNFINSVSTKLSGGVKANCRGDVVLYFWRLLGIFAFTVLQPHHAYMHHRVSSEPKQNTIIHNTYCRDENSVRCHFILTACSHTHAHTRLYSIYLH